MGSPLEQIRNSYLVVSCRFSVNRLRQAFDFLLGLVTASDQEQGDGGQQDGRCQYAQADRQEHLLLLLVEQDARYSGLQPVGAKVRQV